ncbi:hypothetical protein [Clostridium nigeriense]|uniref:hypothetical protein n=1 Tax=Clostridium nigeriense TaxID=1805470 RepID=UPI000B0C81CC|nr:hypothetical protein [Clostridium nigeriense]
MRKILFCNIAWMKNYRGINEEDKPINGGKWVEENNKAHEEYNFDPINIIGEDDMYCLGFVETKSTNRKDSNQLHIEKINNSNLISSEESVDDVLVIWCAKSDYSDFTSIVGWYNNATVFRNYNTMKFENGYEQYYNIYAKAKDCVLLPVNLRARRTLWYVPRTGKKNSPSYGFGQSNVWFANDSSKNII